MPGLLTFTSAHGDETLDRVRFVVRGSSAARAAEMANHGTAFVEGQAFVSTYLLHAYAATETDAGAVNVIAVPASYHLGYAASTSAYVDRSAKRVSGAPVRYAAGRKQLALYTEADTEVVRQRVEQEGSDENGPSYVLSAENFVGSFKMTPAFQSVLQSVEVSVRELEPINVAEVGQSLTELFDCREAAQAVLVPTMVQGLLVGMMEAVVISQMRTLRWQGLNLLGYIFEQDGHELQLETAESLEAHSQRLQRYRSKLESSGLFAGELAWLKKYVARQLDLMRVELDGADLQQA